MKLFSVFRLYFIFLLCKVCISCSDENFNCKNFKTGKFVYHNPFTGNDVLITRTDSIQTSIDEKTSFGNKCSIRWTGACEYKLTFLSFIVNGSDSAFDDYRSSSAATTILNGSKDYYISETKIPGDKVHMDTIWVSSE